MKWGKGAIIFFCKFYFITCPSNFVKFKYTILKLIESKISTQSYLNFDRMVLAALELQVERVNGVLYDFVWIFGSSALYLSYCVYQNYIERVHDMLIQWNTLCLEKFFSLFLLAQEKSLCYFYNNIDPDKNGLTIKSAVYIPLHRCQMGVRINIPKLKDLFIPLPINPSGM